jgi:hypothetical protein
VRDEIEVGFDFDADWYRNREGDTIHRPECRHAAVAWHHADGWTEERLAHYISTMGWVKGCGVCKPTT